MIKTEFMDLMEELDQLNEAPQKQYKITYREDGVSKSFTVLASSKAEAEQKAWSQVDADSVWVTELEEKLTEYFEGSLSDFDGDPNEILRSFTNEYSYSGDAADLACISNRSCPSKVTIDNNKEAEQAAIRKSKEDAQLQAKCLAAAQKAIETGDAAIETYNRGRWSRYFNRAFVPAIDPDTLELVYDQSKKSDICTRAFAAMHQRQSEYNANYAAKRKAKAAGNIEEAVRVVSDPDVLYHATEAENLYKILSEDTLKGSINTRANINAVCLTTDRNYTIYHYPCKIQFSRELLTKGGYEFIPYDEFADDTEGSGESEERVLGDITEVSKYITAVHLNWDQIAIAKSIQPGAEGSYISCPRYDKHTNDEDEAWDLRYEDFITALKKLQASGVFIFQEGRKTYRYWIDENGTPHTGRMPTTPLVAV
jgi:hypothetical protein